MQQLYILILTNCKCRISINFNRIVSRVQVCLHYGIDGVVEPVNTIIPAEIIRIKNKSVG